MLISFLSSWIGKNSHVTRYNFNTSGVVPSQLSTITQIVVSKPKLNPDIPISSCGHVKYIKKGFVQIFEKATKGATCREKRTLAQIALYESGWRPAVKNSRSSASGTLQYLDSTWRSHGCARFGAKTSTTAQLKCGLQDLRKGLIKQWEVWPKIK